MKRGAAIYSDACASCHLENGVGQLGLFPPLGGNSMVQQSDSAGFLHLLLAGDRIAATADCVGTDGQCPACETQFVVPSPEG